MTIDTATIVAFLSGLWLGWMFHQLYWHRRRQQLHATIEQVSSERDAAHLAAQELEVGLLISQTVLSEISAAGERLQEDLALQRRRLDELTEENRRLRTYLERAVYTLTNTTRAGRSPSGIAHVAQIDGAADPRLSRRAV